MTDLVDSLIKYVKDIKPYHTKIFGVEVEYHSKEDININVKEHISVRLDIGIPLSSISQVISPSEYLMDHTVKSGEWDQLGFDSTQWDIPQDYVAVPAGLVQDVVRVTFQERLSFSIDLVGGEAEPQYIQVDRWWDPDIDGISILESTSESVAVQGNVSKMFDQLQSIRLAGTTINDGIYDILTTSYEPIRDITYIHLVQPLFPMPTKVGKIVISYFDYVEWDGDSSFVKIVPPKANVYARSEFGESLTICSGFSWDDRLSSWDAEPEGWDAGEVLLRGNSNKKHYTGWEYLTWDQYYPWDADGYLPGNKYDDEPFDIGLWDADTVVQPIYDNSVGSIAFSAENMPLPSIYDPS